MKYVLITGITSGIGLYLSKLIANKSYSVIGTYRNLQSLEPSVTRLDQIHLLKMDVADESTIKTAFDEITQITAEHGLFALINNAGIAVPGPLTHLPMNKIKYQFEVNLFGPIRMIQYAFPLLRLYGSGSRIINIGSVSGLFAAPYLGAYASSKFALEGISDSLRRELATFNIKVVLIEPGPVKTAIWKKNLEVANDFKDSPYASHLEKARETIFQTEQNALSPEALKPYLLHALNSKHPKPRYLIHKNKILFILLAKILPVPLADFLVQRNLNSGKRKIRPI